MSLKTYAPGLLMAALCSGAIAQTVPPTVPEPPAEALQDTAPEADAPSPAAAGPAASAATSSDAAIDEVIVTAQKRSENVQDVPVTMNVMTAETLLDRDISTINDLQTTFSGLKIDNFGGSSNISIRGVGTTFTSGNGENSVAVHLDGVYLPDPKMATMVQADLASIEVLRGPQSTLYGKNSTAGVINFISAAPTESFEAGVTSGLGNYSEQNLSAYISGPLSDKIRARLYIAGDRHDGYTDNLVTGQDLDNLKGIGGRASVEADVTSNWLLDAVLSYRHEDTNGPSYQPYNPDLPILPPGLSTYEPRKVTSPFIWGAYKELEVLSVRNTVDLSDTTSLVLLSGLSRFNSKFKFDGLASLVTVPLTSQAQSRNVSQEINLKGSTESMKWLLGAFYFHGKETDPATTLLDNLLAGSPAPAPTHYLSVENPQVQRRASSSLFADVTYSLGPKTRVYGGARLLNENLDQELTNYLITGRDPSDYTTTIVCSPETNPQHLNTWNGTGRLGLQQDFAERVMGYTQVSRGYKAGGFSITTCDNEYKPETVTAYEIGLKSQWLERRLTANLSAYYYDYKDLSIEQASVTAIPIVNAPKSHVLGLDFDTRYNLTRIWSTDFNMTLLDSEYDRFVNSDANFAPVGTDLSGIALNKAPGFSGTFGLNLKLPVMAEGAFTLRGEVYGTSKYQLREFDTAGVRQSGFTIYNAYATYTPNDTVTLRAFGKNLSNTDYILGVTGLNGGIVGTFNQPRTFGVEIAVSFK
ncbi:MAG: hypothetical protein JWQ90_4755 [Hydrocarboniphaga sp.]|uniref:TonB-dependent receptor n=1 Tax=Hydrocarboniphaga sp. TaxID=2033016 RepID=UPI00262D4BFC|nr:TonB-dependent receptor [Hydrocarboniphaga sp.]MDB5972305.1 hypothetical protein [Hydrocarboniphaga sp.]